MIGRRALLKQTTAASAALIAISSAALARQAVPLEKSTHPFDRFMAASKYVTGYTDLSPDTGYRIYLAAQGNDWFEDVADVTHPDRLPTALRRKLLAVWYLGVVDTANGPVPAAYEDALMFRPLEGIIPTRSYCPGERFFWAKPPSGEPGYTAYTAEET